MTDPSDQEIEIEVAPIDRVQPGTQAAGLKTAGLLIALGLLPVLAIPIFLLPIANRASRISPQLASQVVELHQHARSLAERLLQANRLAHEQAIRLERASFERAHRQAFDTLSERLGTLLEGKRGEDLSKDQPVVEALKRSSDPFDEVALLVIKERRVALTRTGRQPGELDKALPELAARWAPDRPSPGPADEWTWRTLGDTGFLVAIQSRPPSETGGPAPEPVPIPDPPAGLAELTGLGRSLDTTAWVLSLALPLFAIGLALITLWWLRLQLLIPILALTVAARRVLEDPSEPISIQAANSGLVQDLAASLVRLHHRMQRLAEQDERTERERQTLVELMQALQRARAGKLGQRVAVESGRLQELALAINQLLDAMTERIEGLLRVGQQLQIAAGRLRPVSERLAGRLTAARMEAKLADPAALEGMIRIQLSGLCDVAAQAGDLLSKEAPEPFQPEDLERFRAAIAATHSGFELLRERIAEVTGTSDRLTALRQEAEVLSTNLAISVEARSPTQLERLVDDARSLSRAAADLSEGLSKALGQLATTGDQILEAFGQSSDDFQRSVRQLAQWERMRRSVAQTADELGRRVEQVRPGLANLGADLRDLNSAVTQDRSTQVQLSETLVAAGQGAMAVADTVDALVRLLEQLDTGRPTPAGVTRKLARQQQALEEAIRDLSELASAEGIDALSPDAQDILDRIRTMAESARTRIEQQIAPPPSRPRLEPDA